MNETKLLDLASKLRTIDPNRFNINLWADKGFYANKCGTAACAIGWCPIFYPDDWVVDNQSGMPKLKSAPDVVYDLRVHIEARNYFELSNEEVEDLFIEPASDITPTELADFIEAYIRRNLS